MREILLGAEAEILRLGKIGQRLGKTFGPLLEVVNEFGAVLDELLFEERVQNDGGGAGVFHRFDGVDFFR